MGVLCNANKLGRRALSLVAPLDWIDMLVTDRTPAEGLAAALLRGGASTIMADPTGGSPPRPNLTNWNRRRVMFEFFDRRRNVVIAMAHIGALPGSPLFDSKGGVQKLIDDVGSDVRNLQTNGVHAIMFGNENDRPYRFKAPTELVAAMTAVISALKPERRSKMPSSHDSHMRFSFPRFDAGNELR